jgi:hypothetical protein
MVLTTPLQLIEFVKLNFNMVLEKTSLWLLLFVGTSHSSDPKWHPHN